MFGYRLRSNVVDPEEVDIMIKKVYRLLNHVLNVDYDIFVPNNKDNWEATLDYFYKELQTVENQASVVLDQCIDSLKSAEQGLELVGYLNTIETREKLLKHLLSKKESIMRKFVTEVGIVEHEFLVGFLLNQCLSLQSSIEINFLDFRFFLFFLRNFIQCKKEIQKESATSKESEQILGGCYMGALIIGKIEEIRNRFPKCESYFLRFSYRNLFFSDCTEKSFSVLLNILLLCANPAEHKKLYSRSSLPTFLDSLCNFFPLLFHNFC